VAGFGAHDAKPNLNVHNNNADPLRYGVSASAASMVADQPGRVPERCVDLCNALNGRFDVVPDGN
jgi:hypothetical protein